MQIERKREKTLLTPELATKFLQLSPRNRPTDRMHVERLATAMNEGRFRDIEDPIRFDWNGKLIDGHHRCLAVIKSGVSVVVLVVYGLDPEDFRYIDGESKPRRAPDVLSLEGYRNCRDLAATLSLIEKYYTNRTDDKSGFANDEIIAIANKYPSARLSIAKSWKLKSIIPCSLAAACHYIFSQIDMESADSFVEQLISGAGLTEGDSLLALRNRLIANTTSKAKLSTEYRFALCIKAWNHRRNGTSCRFLRWRESGPTSEDFPKAI